MTEGCVIRYPLDEMQKFRLDLTVSLATGEVSRFDKGTNLYQSGRASAQRRNLVNSFNQTIIRHKVGLLNLASEPGVRPI